MKRREFLKTLLLTVLVISSVILASKIWFSEELWSDDYNSFNYSSVLFQKISSIFKKNPKTASLDYNQIFFPKQYVVLKNGKTNLIRPTDSGYDQLSNDIKDILSDMFKKFSITDSDETEFRRVCRSPSVFVDFYNYTSLRMLSDYFNLSKGDEISEINSIKHLLISLDNPAVYVKNDSNGNIYKITFTSDFNDINSRAESLTASSSEASKLYSYAFENSFDVPSTDENAPKRLLLDPYIIINIEGKSIPGIKISDGVKIDSRDYGKLLSAFGMNINTSRRFSENDGTVNLVENFAAVKIRGDRSLEYDCISPSKGISLNSAASDYEIIKSAGEFLGKVSSFYPLPEGNDYVFARITRAEEKYTVCFDITYNGIPVLLYDENRGDSAHCVEITVENSKIISYRHSLVSFQNSGNNAELKNMINALDEFYSTYDTGADPSIIINDIYNTYYYGKNDSVSVKWVVSLSNNDSVVLEGGV